MQRCRAHRRLTAWLRMWLALIVAPVFWVTASVDPAAAATCPSVSGNGSHIIVTYFLTASGCTTTNPGSGVVAGVDVLDFSKTAYFAEPYPRPVDISGTGNGCAEFGPPWVNGRAARYSGGANATCTTTINLTGGGHFRFTMQHDADGWGTELSGVSFELTPGADMQTDFSQVYSPQPTAGVPYSGLAVCRNSVTAPIAATQATCSVSGLPPGYSAGTCTPALPVASLPPGNAIGCPITGTAAEAGVYRLRITTSASNESYSADNHREIDFLVRGAKFEPDLSGLPSDAIVGQPYTGTVTCKNAVHAASYPAYDAQCDVTGLPSWAHLDACTPATPVPLLEEGQQITCQVSGTPDVPSAVNVTATASSALVPSKSQSKRLTAYATPGLALSVTVNPSGFSRNSEVLTYTYAVRNTGGTSLSGVALSDTRAGNIACPATVLTAGAAMECTGTTVTTASDMAAKVITSSSEVTGHFGASQTATATAETSVRLDVDAVQQVTRAAIGNFLAQRANIIASSGPDTNRMHDRLTGGTAGAGGSANNGSPPGASGLGGPRSAVQGEASAFELGSGTSRTPVRVVGASHEAGGQVSFSASLEQMRLSAGSYDQPMGLGAGPRPGTVIAPSPIDVWVEGSYTYFDSDHPGGNISGHAGLLFAGADALIANGLLAGFMVQLDWMDQSASSAGHDAGGDGWMAGPYISAALAPNLFLDARAAWGRADNHIDPLGYETDHFDSSRVLGSAKLTGEWQFGVWRVSPSAEITYFSERQEAYTNGLGIGIGAQSVTLGRLVFGPELAYRMDLVDGSALEPFFALDGIWDFDSADATSVAAMPVSPGDWRARIEAGATFQTPGGIALRASGAYDGLGSSDGYEAWRGQGSLHMPF